MRNRNNGQRRFLGGNTKGLRYRAALDHLNKKADEVRSKGMVTMTLRSDAKALIQESDLRIWASEQGFEIQPVKGQDNAFHVAKVVKAVA